VAFYRERAPEKLADVDDILREYRGEEEEMMRALRRKYGDEPAPPPAGPPPSRRLLALGGSVLQGSVRSVGWLVGADRAADAGDAPPPQLYNRDG